MGHHYMAQNKVKLAVDREYLVNMLLFLGETDRVKDSLIRQIEAGAVVPEDYTEDCGSVKP